MSFTFIANLIIILCVLGILVIFLRRIPEVVQETGQLQFGNPGNRRSTPAPVVNSARSWNLLAPFKSLALVLTGVLSKIGNSIWHFMLEAKDLKQSQILAAKFSSLVRPRGRIINIGAFNSIKKAERLFQEGKADEAEQTYIQVIRKHPHEYMAYEGLLKIYFKQKKYDDITEILEFLVSHNPQNDLYLAQLGNVMISTRRFPEAIDAYQRSLSYNGLVPARFVNLGLAFQGAGDMENAKNNFQKAVDLDPSNMQYLTILVDSLVQLNERDAAIAYLKSANQKDPENVVIKEKLIALQ